MKEDQKVPRTYRDIQQMTSAERFQLASETYTELVSEDPSLSGNPGDMASRISEKTGLDFSTAAAVALSAPAQ